MEPQGPWCRGRADRRRICLSLQPRPAQSARAGTNADAGRAPAVYALVALDFCFARPATVEEARVHLERCGVAVELRPVERFGGGHGRSAYFRGPDGSLLELIAYADR